MLGPEDEEDYSAYDDEPEEMDEFEDSMMDCQLMPDGQCMLAGSEHCDFECPMRDSEHFAGSAAWNAKRAHLKVVKE